MIAIVNRSPCVHQRPRMPLSPAREVTEPQPDPPRCADAAPPPFDPSPPPGASASRREVHRRRGLVRLMSLGPAMQPNTDSSKRTYTVEETARALGISRSTAYECIRTGEIPYLRFRRRIVIAAAVLDQMLSVPAPEEGSSKSSSDATASAASRSRDGTTWE